jgi:hypothetical protein
VDRDLSRTLQFTELAAIDAYRYALECLDTYREVLQQMDFTPAQTLINATTKLHTPYPEPASLEAQYGDISENY